jgi:predicted polyphosphate/ATP-dependent NAD kinase
MFRGTLVGTRLPPLPVRAWLDGANPLHDGRPRRVEMIVFWSASETSAESALRLADSLAAAHGPERLRVVTVHTSVGPEDFEAPQARFDTIRARHPSLPTAIDDGSSALRRCRLSAVPSIVFVDADGTIRGALDNYRRGRIDDIAAFVEKLLSEPR